MTSNIFSSLPQPFTALPYQRLVTSNSSWSCTGSNPALCREDQSESSHSSICFDLGKEGQSQTFCLFYPTVGECFKITSANLLFFFTLLLHFRVFWQYTSFITLHEGGGPLSLRNLLKSVPRESDLEEKDGEDVAYMYTDEEKELMELQDGVRDFTSIYSKVIVLVEQPKGKPTHGSNRKSRKELRGSESGIMQS